MSRLKNMRRRHPGAGMLIDLVSISADMAHHPSPERARPVGRVAGAGGERVDSPPQMAVVSAPRAAKPPLRLVGSEPSPWDLESDPSVPARGAAPVVVAAPALVPVAAVASEPEPEPVEPEPVASEPEAVTDPDEIVVGEPELPGGAVTEFEVIDESTGGLDPHLRGSRAVSVISRLLQVVCIIYGAALLYWIWMAKDLSVGLVLHDPVFGTYSLLVTLYVLTRFVLAPFYRPTPDTGHRPTASIVIPAFNEQTVIGQTIDACYGAEYPEGRLEVVAVDDGSSDDTWGEMLRARKRHPSLVCIQFSHNRGKRAAMAEGIRHSTGEVCVFIDSDSVIEKDGLGHIMADFRDNRVGAVVGTADVLNKGHNLITKMQQVRYYVAFRVIKGSESIFGAVTCASGCFSAYRRTALLGILDAWENQKFLGRKATYGDDRALTNMILRNHRVTFQSTAKSHTIAPHQCTRSWCSSCGGRRAGCASRCTSCGSSGASIRSRRP